MFCFPVFSQTEYEEAKQALERAKSVYSKTNATLNYQRTHRIWEEALENWVKVNDAAAKSAWEKVDRSLDEARIAWKKDKVEKTFDKTDKTKDFIRKHLKEELGKTHMKVIKACKIDSSKRLCCI